MLRLHTHTIIAAALFALSPAIVLAQGFYSPYGSSYGGSGSSCYGSSPYVSGSQQFGGYGSSYGTTYGHIPSCSCPQCQSSGGYASPNYGGYSSPSYGGISSGGCNCPDCQGQMGHGGGCNCPDCQCQMGQGGGCNCPDCQGQFGGQACALHGIVNCPQCMGLNSHVPLQNNLNDYSGPQYQQQYSPYFEDPNYRTRGTYQPAPSPSWYGTSTTLY